MIGKRGTTQSQTQAYLRNQVFSASPGQLRLMLYDGALRFCRKARNALEKKRYEDSYTAIVRAQKIVLELSTSLKHDTSPDICGKLASLYNYIYRKLIEASTERNIDALDDAMQHLQYDRETWMLLMQKTEQPTPHTPGSGTLSHMA